MSSMSSFSGCRCAAIAHLKQAGASGRQPLRQIERHRNIRRHPLAICIGPEALQQDMRRLNVAFYCTSKERILDMLRSVLLSFLEGRAIFRILPQLSIMGVERNSGRFSGANDAAIPAVDLQEMPQLALSALIRGLGEKF